VKQTALNGSNAQFLCNDNFQKKTFVVAEEAMLKNTFNVTNDPVTSDRELS
jgi:hypothetical protein